MLTIIDLLNLAITVEETDARLSREAMTAAEWMEQQGIEEIAQIGNLGGKPDLKKGDRVRIKKGTVIRSMHPRHTRDNPKIAGRDYVVTLHDVYQGYLQSHWHDHDRKPFRNQEIVWPGEGGYWCHVDTSLVEVVS